MEVRKGPWVTSVNQLKGVVVDNRRAPDKYNVAGVEQNLYICSGVSFKL